MEGTSFVEIADAKSGFSFQSANSKTVSGDNSEESDISVENSGEFQLFLKEKQGKSRKHKKQAGFSVVCEKISLCSQASYQNGVRARL